MIEKIDTPSNVSQLQTEAVTDTPQTVPDLPGMIEEENVRDALSLARDVLNDLSETILPNDQANSPDADRNQGRMSAEVFDLVSG